MPLFRRSPDVSPVNSPRPTSRSNLRSGLLLLVALLLLCRPAGLRAQQPAQGEGVVRGTVLAERTGDPIAGATVSLVLGRATARTNDSGRFVLRIPAGSHSLRVVAAGYEPALRPITISAGDTTAIVIVVTPIPQKLEVVTTTARPIERETFEQLPQVGNFTVKASTLRAAPTLAEPDVLRAVTLMPGMVVRSDFTAGYNVRGGESDQNLILLDGIPVYNPFHLGGLFGTFIDETIQDVNLQTGGFASPYGGRLSSLLDVTTASEARRGIH